MNGRMVGRAIGFGYCTCLCCGRPEPKTERRKLKRRERQHWKRSVAAGPSERSSR